MSSIRRAGTTDREQLLELIGAFYTVDDHPFDAAHITAALDPLLVDDRHGQVWLATSEADEQLAVGYAVVTWGWSLESGGPESLLDELFVSDRGRGLGAGLIEWVKHEAARHGARSMLLETEAPNEAARRFYRRHGFSDEGSTWMIAQLELVSETD